MRENDSHNDWRDDVAAYLLGTLEPGETAALERHLEECVDCRTELNWLTPAAQLLPESVEREELPDALRSRILAEVRADVSEEPATAEGTKQAKRPFRSRRWRLSLRPALALATVLVAVVVAGYAIQSGGEDGSPGNTAPAGATPISAKVERRGDQGILRLANLSHLPSGKVYEAWVQRGDRVAPAHALFEPNPDGTATAVIQDMDGVDAVMVTAEPRGGSSQPTSEPIVSVSTVE